MSNYRNRTRFHKCGEHDIALERVGTSARARHTLSGASGVGVTLPRTLPHTAEPLVSRIILVSQCFARIFGRCRIPDNGRFPHGSRVSRSHDQRSTKPAVASSCSGTTLRAPQAPHTPSTKSVAFCLVVFAIDALQLHHSTNIRTVSTAQAVWPRDIIAASAESVCSRSEASSYYPGGSITTVCRQCFAFLSLTRRRSRELWSSRLLRSHDS